MKCSVNRSTTLTIDLTPEESKAFRTVIDVLATIDSHMDDHNICGLSSDDGNYNFDTILIARMMDTLAGLKFCCSRWVEVE